MALEAFAKEAGVSLNQRPQEISPAEWLAMAKNFNCFDEFGKKL